MSADDKLSLERIQNLISANVPLVLFIGTGVKELSRSIIDFPWSCVVTTQVQSDLAVQFRKDGVCEVEELESLTGLENRLVLSRRNLKFVHLFKPDEQSKIKRIKAAAEMLKLITGFVRSSFGFIFIVGYSLTNEELSSERLAEIFDDTRKESVLMFGTPFWEDESLQDAVNSGSIVPFEDPLETYLDNIMSVEPEEDDDYEFFDESGSLLFINKKAVAIETAQLFATQGFAKLLTSAEMDAVHVPDELQREFFSKFLSESVSMPMWFGYKYKFNLQRTFEKKLHEKVQSAFRNVNDRESQGLIVVSGQTGSSKSIALANLAFHVYQERVYPVIFIFDKNISFKYGDGNFNALEKLVLALEKKGARTVLIIWDNSAAYTDPIPGALHLLQGLRRRGRQCVLVCSAYMVSASLSKDSGKKGVRIEEVETNINLSAEEARQLRQKVLQFGAIEEYRYDTWVKNEDSKNLLTLLYTLFTETLGGALANGVRNEVYQTTTTFLDVLNNIIDTLPESINSMAAELRKAGLALRNEPQSQGQSLSADMKKFLLLIAVASQFGVEMPLQFVLSVAGLKRLENRFLHTIRTLHMIPLLRLPERAEDSRFNYGQTIIFRTPIEARLYLDQCTTVENEINLVVELIKALTDEHKYMEARALELLIRTMGPNSPLRKGRIPFKIFYEYEVYYVRIIDALSDMRRKQGVIIPRLMCQEISWMREVFGKANKHLSAEERIEKLNEAISIAKSGLSKIRPGTLPAEEQITQNNLIVEMATSAWQIQQLKKDDGSIGELSYDYDYYREALEKVIQNAPDNGYAYNALLKLFIEMYRTYNATDRSVDALSNILSLLESYEHIMGEVAANEEFIQHKNDIMEFVGDEAVKNYLDELIEQRRPSGLYLWARRCLMAEGINLDERVPKEKHAVLEDIVSFFTQHMDMVKTHGGCLFMLLRLKWQLFNFTPIFEKEKQVTKISRQQWEELAYICRGDTPSQGSIAHLLYIFALVEAQIGNYDHSIALLDRLAKMVWLPPRSIYVWHILCEEDGTPRLFSGRIEKQETSLRIIDVRETADRNMRIPRKIFARSIHSLQVNEAAGTYDDFEIGLNFKGFQAFRKLGGLLE